MREILFHGKRTDNGEWVEGFLMKIPSAIQIGDMSPWYIDVPPKDPEDTGGRYNIAHSTIGQYTGLKDKNGKRIFEGDILGSRYDDLYPDDVTVETVVWFRHAWHRIQGDYYPELIEEEETLPYSEVIGNIHDNPELVGGGEG